MRKVFAIIILSILSPVLFAQSTEFLVKKIIKPDRLRGEDGHVEWVSKHVSFQMLKYSQTIALFNPPGHIFSYDAKVGLYDSRGTLLAMTETCKTTFNDDQTVMWMYDGFTNDSLPNYTMRIPEQGETPYLENQYILGRLKKCKYVLPVESILRFLQETNGYARIVATLYGGGVMDIKVKIRK